MSRVYPFRWYEKALVVLVLAVMLAGTGMGALQKVEDGVRAATWRVCVLVGFLISFEYCWEFGSDVAPCPPPPPSCDPSSQSCP